MEIGFVSLGCSKNLVDTEAIIGKFKNKKYRIQNKPEEAEIIIINTCGFIEESKEEAINTILEMAEYKKYKCKYLIVIGCLVQRYYNELIEALPEVDLFIRIDEYPEFWDKIENLIKKGKIEKTKFEPITKVSKIKELPMLKQEEYENRVITTGNNYAYIKIGEGCSNMCTYCAIPYIRGKFVSRKIEDILEEAKKLASTGIKEIILIAQDTTKYGIDIYGRSMLVKLLQELRKIEGIKWIRFLYSYPEGITEELIQEVKNNDKICKYLDIPIQHISNEMLKKMNRKTTKQEIEKLIQKIKKEIPEITLRTSLIVGFPGETQEQFNELNEFIKKVEFDKLGTFMYSKEEGTPAARMENQIHGNTKKSRYNKIMQAQKEISNNKLKNKINKEYEILIETTTFDNRYIVGRTSQDVPEIDGLVYIKNTKKDVQKLTNQFVKCKIIDVKDYDLIAEII
ncbi:MAG: 30S ribosomal protein S12 methylthiotransferase RimO [Clostridia bacterium]|nr:30S ribosomal protein S12 methylthiotransferase RimO [Clostridia bacterium]